MLKMALISYVTNSVKAIWSAVAHPLTIVSTKECNVKDYKIYGGGENLLDVESAWSEYANDEGGISYTNADFSSVGIIDRIKCDWKENTQYIFSFNYEIETSENRLMLIVKYADGGQNIRYIPSPVVSVVGYGKGHYTFTTDENRTITSIQVWYDKYIDTTVKLTNMKLQEYTELTSIPITIRGKNYFNLANVPFSNGATEPYNNGLKAKKLSSTNRGDKIPISLPIGKEIKMTMEVVDSQIGGTVTRVTMGFYNSKNTLVRSTNVTSTKAKKSYTFTLSEEVSYIQFYFQSANDKNAVGDYVTMDNIMLRTEGDDSFELYIKPQTVEITLNEPLEVIQKSVDGLPNLPQYNGTTTYEVLTDTPPSGIQVQYYG